MPLANRLQNVLGLLVGLACISGVVGFPAYGSLAGMSEAELHDVVAGLVPVTPGLPPGPLEFNGTKLVNDRDHPWMPLQKGDIRGTCPGLNTLASHGYLPRNGVATPAQLIQAVQEGLNMDHAVAQFFTYAAHIMDGNLLTDLVSIGEKTRRTGPDTPPPAIIGGMNTHGTFEGDASLSRADTYFGDNHSFNQTLFDQFIDYSNRYGGGFYNSTVAGELRNRRTQESIATNPEFNFSHFRFFAAYGEATFPYTFFVDGRISNRTIDVLKLSMDNATLFFRDSRMPDDFWRPPAPTGPIGTAEVYAAYPILPGRNVNGTNSYTPDPTSAGFGQVCAMYTNLVNNVITALYPNPQGILRRNLIINLGYMYGGLPSLLGCPEISPYGTL